MTNKLSYVKTPKPYPEATVFSPSQFAKFIEKPHLWYREQILGESGFTGNTSSVIGTIVHYIAEAVANDEPVDKAEIERYIDSKEPSEDYDPDTVRLHYPEMAEVLINDYVLENKNNFLATELQLTADLNKDYFIGGTIDIIEGSAEDAMISDYKTYSSSTKPKRIPNNYKYQLLIYAAMALANNFNVTRIRLVYVSRGIVGEISPKTGRQFKSYPSEVTVLTEVLTDEDMDFIKSMLYLCVDSLEATKKQPELTHIIWHDPRLQVKLKDKSYTMPESQFG
jgi:RecB family exonuclease